MSEDFEITDSSDATQESADTPRRGRPPKPKTVRMKRDPEFYPAPNEADVHPDEVENWKMHNWVEA